MKENYSPISFFIQTGRSTTKIQLPSSEAHSAMCDLLRVLYCLKYSADNDS